jgi:hypothetical protein
MIHEIAGCYLLQDGEWHNADNPALILQKGVYPDGKEFLLKLNGEDYPLMLADLFRLDEETCFFEHEGVKHQYHQAYEDEVMISYLD